jgi:ligand-binding sensor domain-containing protein
MRTANHFFLNILISLILLSCSATPVYSQQPLFFENYTSEKGLSQNSCFAIAQDADGFMWFGTQDGLNRYDGKEFKVFLPQNEIGKNLPSNHITSLYFDKYKKLLWVGTRGGLCIYSREKDAIIKVTNMFSFGGEFENTAIKKIISFKENEYWIITFEKGLWLLNTALKKITKYFDDEKTREKVSGIALHNGTLYVTLLKQLYWLNAENNNYSPRVLLPDFSFPEIKELFSYNDELWVGTLDGGCFYIKNPVNDKKNICPFSASKGGVGSFVTDAYNKLWIGTRGNGIILYDPFTKKTQQAVHDKYDNRSIEKNFILSLFKDRQGIIWCGSSGGGVAKYDSLKYRFQNISNEPFNRNSLPDNMVFDVYQSKKSNYYIGMQNKGLAEFNPATRQFLTFPQSSTFGAVGNTIYDITEDDNENLWIASWGGLMKLDFKTKKILFKEEKDLLLSKKLYGIHKLKNADSLFICGENGFIFFSLKENKWQPVNKNLSQAKAFIGRYIYEDDDSILWICTTGAGLIKYDYKHNKTEVIEEVKKYAGYVRHLLPDGPLFFLSTDNGIVLYNYKTGKVKRRITINTDKISNVCYAAQKDDRGFYWVSSNTGLYKINPKDYSSHNYDLGDGLTFLEYNTACAVKQRDGSLLFGGVGGITHFNPLQLKENNFSPSPIITAVSVNDSVLKSFFSFSNDKAISLKHNQNFLSISFAVNNFSNQHKNSFAYQLTGIDKGWVYNGTKNIVNYTSLPPGEYTFQLKSANSDGVWCDKPVTLKFTISPPWWQTWWFRTPAFLSIAGLIMLLIRRRIKTIKHRAELKHKIAEVEMMALRLQMNPHFIFNSLNSINSFIVENKTHLASDYLTKFSRLMRLILDNSKNESITLEKEIETLKLYLLMESIRFDKKFDYTFHIDPAIEEQMIKVPPMIIQPYVENAVWHGLLQKEEKGKVEIRITKVNNAMQIVIQDNGIGRRKASQLKSKNSTTNKSYGMQITAQRIEQLNRKNKVETIDLKNEQENAAGTKVVLTICLNNEV